MGPSDSQMIQPTQQQAQVGQGPSQPLIVQSGYGVPEPSQQAPQPMPAPLTNLQQSTQQHFSTSEVPIVETVTPSGNEPAPARQYRPTPIEGTGIDARSEVNPKQKAEQQILSSAGAPGSAQGRIALLQSALACELPKFLVEHVLENATLFECQRSSRSQSSRCRAFEIAHHGSWIWPQVQTNLGRNAGLEEVQIARPFAVHYGVRTKSGLLSH